jgi:hypothetical protein
MAVSIKNNTSYKNILKKQDLILRELKELKTLSILGHFDELAMRGRKFAKMRGIKRPDVLKND